MSAKHSYTTSDYLPWDIAMSLVRKLYKDGNYKMSLLLGCGFFFGLRISDLKALTWAQILNVDEFTIIEHKTGKRRIIYVNSGFKGHIADCHDALNIKDNNHFCFPNRYGSEMSIQILNRHLKWIKTKYKVPINNFTTHTMRKTWARKIWENETIRGQGEQSLEILSKIMNHSSVTITRRYLGIRQQKIGQIYESLQF